MKFNYYPETDSLYIDLSSKKSVASEEIKPGIVLDFDKDNNLVGIDIDHASKKIDLSILEAKELPVKGVSVA
jgi:uncharacterized protein YuzE